jgi:hypothetical protein
VVRYTSCADPRSGETFPGKFPGSACNRTRSHIELIIGQQHTTHTPDSGVSEVYQPAGDSEQWRYCHNCGHRLARFRGVTLEGLTLDVCPLCMYVLSPNQDQAIPLSPMAVASVPCDDGPGTFVAGNSYEQDGHLTYALDVRCPGCGRAFVKLVARKDGQVYVPQHSIEAVLA